MEIEKARPQERGHIYFVVGFSGDSRARDKSIGLIFWMYLTKRGYENYA
jgi:hypothetical protein